MEEFEDQEEEYGEVKLFWLKILSWLSSLEIFISRCELRTSQNNLKNF